MTAIRPNLNPITIPTTGLAGASGLGLQQTSQAAASAPVDLFERITGSGQMSKQDLGQALSYMTQRLNALLARLQKLEAQEDAIKPKPAAASQGAARVSSPAAPTAAPQAASAPAATQAPAAAPAAPQSRSYTVQPGDYLAKIAAREGVPLNQLIAANPQIKNPNLIYAGQQIHIPGRAGASAAKPVAPIQAPGNSPGVGRATPNQAGANLAAVAKRAAERHSTTGWCYKGVSDALQKAFGFAYRGASAYMAADKYAAHPEKFTEIKGLSSADLKKLPAGAIVVWDNKAGSKHGHISISLGDGREVSDHVQKQMTHHKGSAGFRVFMPNANLG